MQNRAGKRDWTTVPASWKRKEKKKRKKKKKNPCAPHWSRLSRRRNGVGQPLNSHSLECLPHVVYTLTFLLLPPFLLADLVEGVDKVDDAYVDALIDEVEVIDVIDGDRGRSLLPLSLL